MVLVAMAAQTVVVAAVAEGPGREVTGQWEGGGSAFLFAKQNEAMRPKEMWYVFHFVLTNQDLQTGSENEACTNPIHQFFWLMVFFMPMSRSLSVGWPRHCCRQNKHALSCHDHSSRFFEALIK